MSIRACSRLDEIVVGKPKELFGRFRRLGIYQWADVLRTARNDMDRDIMALRFSDTELFQAPVARSEFRKLGIKSNLQSPVSISDDQFSTIYKAGTARA